MFQILPILGILKWPATLVGAMLVFGLSTEGTLSLISENADRMTSPTQAAPNFNVASPVIRTAAVPILNEVKVSTSQVETPAANATTLRQWGWDGLGKSAPRVSTEMAQTVGPISTSIGRVGSSAVNLRTQPSKASARLAVLAPGTAVKIGEKSGGWVNVYYDGGSGWMYSTYLAGDVQSAELATSAFSAVADPTPRSAQSAKIGRTVKAGNRIVVRESPSSGSSRVSALAAGERVRILETDGAWARIVTATGESGWIRVQ